MDKEKIQKLVEDTINSINYTRRAETKAYLFTRIHARLNNVKESTWETASRFLTRPVVIIGLVILFAINVVAVTSGNSITSDNYTESSTQAGADEFYYSVITIYDIENTEIQ